MNLIADTCSLVNLRNGGALSVVAQLPNVTIWVSPQVVEECNPECAAEVFALAAAGSLHLIDEAALDADRFLDLKGEHRLGDGETECILVAEALDYSVCTDDSKARQVATTAFGAARVVGSARLLQWTVENGLSDCLQANGHFDEMKVAGGYLPPLTHAFFCGDCDH